MIVVPVSWRKEVVDSKVMDNGLGYCISLCYQLDQLLEDDYLNIASYLKGDLYDAYKKLVMRERQVLEESIELLLRCNCM